MKLKKFEIKSGGQFNQFGRGPVVIDFSMSKMVGAKGDETTGKSTILELFLMACGQNGGAKVVEALKNRSTKEIDLELSFVGNDKANYDVKVKNTRIVVKREGEALTSPVELLKQQLGVVGVNPMWLKTAQVNDIVKWLSSYSTKSPEEFEKEMRSIKDGIKSAKSVRAQANKSAKALKEYLRDEGYIDDAGDLIEKKWKESEKKYANKPDISQLSKKLNDAGAKSDKYIENQSKVNAQKERRAEIERQISQLMEEAEKVDSNIAIGEAWLEKNKSAKTDYDTIKKAYDSAASDTANYNKWQEVVRKREEMDEFEEVSLSADVKEKTLIKDQQELQWEIIPDIKGLELILEDTHEEEGEQKKAGFYINGFSSMQMSNSEWLGAIIKILKKNKVRVMVIDDVSQFGSSLMSTLQELSKSGCYILYTEMKRGTTEIEIEY